MKSNVTRNDASPLSSIFFIIELESVSLRMPVYLHVTSSRHTVHGNAHESGRRNTGRQTGVVQTLVLSLTVELLAEDGKKHREVHWSVSFRHHLFQVIVAGVLA